MTNTMKSTARKERRERGKATLRPNVPHFVWNLTTLCLILDSMEGEEPANFGRGETLSC